MAKKNSFSSRFKKVSRTRIVLGVLLILGVVFCREIFGFLKTNQDTLRLYLNSILVWPLVALVITLIIISSFKDEIRKFLSQISEVKISKGSVSAKTKEEQPTKVSAKPSVTESEEVLKKAEREAARANSKLKSMKRSSKEQAELVNTLLERSKRFEFKWLDKFLVNNSKRVLLRISETANSRMLKATLTKKMDEVLKPTNRTKKEELDVILDVLVTYDLLDKKGNYLVLTDKGREFLETADLPTV